MIKSRNILSAVVAIVESDKNQLKRCLISLEDSVYNANLILEIIIVCNGTNIIKPKYLKSEYKIIKNNENIGLGRAINRGMEIARGEWCIILTPDTYSDLETINKLMKFTSRIGTAIISPKNLTQNGTIDYTILCSPSILNIFLEQSYLYKLLPSLIHHPQSDRFLYSKTEEVSAIACNFWLMNRYIFNRLRGFDTKFFLFYEDLDFCKRITNRGYKIIYTPDTFITHIGHQSSKGVLRVDLFTESLIKYLLKYHNKTYLHICLLLILLGSTIRLLYWWFRLRFQSIKKPEGLIQSKLDFNLKITSYIFQSFLGKLPVYHL